MRGFCAPRKGGGGGTERKTCTPAEKGKHRTKRNTAVTGRHCRHLTNRLHTMDLASPRTPVTGAFGKQGTEEENDDPNKWEGDTEIEEVENVSSACRNMDTGVRA